MNNHPNRSRGAYIVMDAPGCYGSHATVYSRHTDLDAAIRAARKHKGRAIVSTDGGFAGNHQPGSVISSQFALRYETIWSMQQDGEAQAQAQDREYEEYAARTWGHDTDAYREAMADDHGRRNFRESKPHWAE
jgi:hypothetical protein